jgi:hypothetical protein
MSTSVADTSPKVRALRFLQNSCEYPSRIAASLHLNILVPCNQASSSQAVNPQESVIEQIVKYLRLWRTIDGKSRLWGVQNAELLHWHRTLSG